VRIGRRTVEVREFSTGARTRAEAEVVGAAEEARIRAEVLDTGAVVEPPRRVTVAECIAAYKARPGGLHPFDVARLDELAVEMGDVTMSGVREAWGAWLRGRGGGLAASTVARWRSTLLAALSYGAEEFGVAAPTIRAVKGAEVERIAYLNPQQEARLLAAYSAWAAPVMLVLCETGMRTQEALRLDWRHVDFEHGALRVEHAGRRDGPRTKSGRSRRIGMRPVVRETLHRMWVERGRPETGTVFLNKRKKPYADTRQIGGNPLASAHRTACRKAGIAGFRIHDWRHHFAVHFLKRGGNLRALCQIAGWSSMRMVQRYAVFEQSDLDEVMARTAAVPPAGQSPRADA
jgi:integrase